MTKMVRIENADSGPYFKPVVQIWDKGFEQDENGAWIPSGKDTLVKEVILHNPCDITGLDVYITGTRYLVIKELEQITTKGMYRFYRDCGRSGFLDGFGVVVDECFKAVYIVAVGKAGFNSQALETNLELIVGATV